MPDSSRQTDQIDPQACSQAPAYRRGARPRLSHQALQSSAATNTALVTVSPKV